MGYMNVAEIEAAVISLASAYPAMAGQIELPHLTHEGRRVLALQIGDISSKPTFMLLGGVHARELVPPDLMISLAADLLEARSLGLGLRYGGKYFKSTEIADLLASMALLIVPCVNPDGRQFVRNGNPCWRKNRNPAHGHGASPRCGVDLNRNFDFLWDHEHKFAPDSGVATSSDPASLQFRGDAAASEPEIKNVVHLLDQTKTIRWFVDVHAYVPAIFHAWGSDQPQTKDPAMNFMNPTYDGHRGRVGDTAYREYIPEADLKLVQRMAGVAQEAVALVRGHCYGVSPAFELYPTSGASDDYCYSRHFLDPSKSKVVGFTIECGRGRFDPPWAEAEHIIRETSSGLIALMLHALAPPPVT